MSATTAMIDSPKIALRSDYVEARLRRFRTLELINRKRPSASRMAADIISRAVPFVAGYVLMVAVSWPYNVAGTAIFAMATVSLLGSWFHDTVHRNMRAPRVVIFILQRMGASPVGFSPQWWIQKHVRLHHRFPGNPEFDPDIQFGILGRVSSAQPWRIPHATQHIHMWLLLPLSTLNMLKPSEVWLVRRYAKTLGPGIRKPAWIYMMDKYVGVALVWLPAFLVQPVARALLTFLCFHLFAGTLVSFITQVQHNTALSDGGTDYSTQHRLCEQVARTTDVGNSTGFWWWLCGGVNFHVAHHLAPTFTFLELPGVTSRLRLELRKMDLELPTHSGMLAAIRSHAALIRHLSHRPPGTLGS